MNPYRIQKKISGVVVGLVLLSSIGLAVPQTTHASLILDWDVPNSVLQLGTFIEQTANTILESDNFVKEYVLDPLAWVAKEMVLQSMTQSLLNWAESGFDGSPAFVTDLRRNLGVVGDTVALRALAQMQSDSRIDSPFRNQVTSSIRNTYFRNTGGGGIGTRNPYTLRSSCANDAAFLSGDFLAGGLDCWRAAWSNPANNPEGSRILATDALLQQVGSEQETRQEELRWGQGVLSWRSCSEQEPSTIAAATAPRSLAGTAGTSCPRLTFFCQFQQLVPNTPNLLNRCMTEEACRSAGGRVTGTVVLGAPLVPAATLPPVNLTQTDRTVGCSIQTPGSVAAHAINKTAVDLGIDVQVGSDEMNEIITGLINGLLNDVLSKGLGGSGKRASGGGSGQGASASAAANLTGSLLSVIANQKSRIEQYKNSWERIHTVTLAAKTHVESCGVNMTETSTNLYAARVSETLAKSTAALTKATAALIELNNFQTRLGDTQNPNNTLEKISADYQAYTSAGAGNLPSPQEIATSNQESQDNDLPDPSVDPLYHQMNVIPSVSCLFIRNADIPTVPSGG